MTSIQLLIEKINHLLPQTQCTQCGYSGCRPYAEAIAIGAAQHNQCPPGGAEGIKRLSFLLGKDVLPLNPANGIEQLRTLAIIDPTRCIGCTLCIQACPVDAIVGTAKHMHVVLEDWCTGCNLCIPPCPVDCIDSTPVGTKTGRQNWSQQQADQARLRHERRKNRDAQKLLKRTLQANTLIEQKSNTSNSKVDDEQTRKRTLINKILISTKVHHTSLPKKPHEPS